MSTRAETPELVTPTLLRGWPLPGGGSGKNDRGSVLVVGGARKTPGAALLAGVAALRSGAGRLTLAVAESTAVPLAVAFPESGVVGLPETARGSVKGSAASLLADQFDAADAVLIGPGLDDKDEALALLRGLLLPGQGKPKDGPAVVLDAYALGCLPDLADELKPWAGRLILTPNTAEGGILLGRDIEDLKLDVRKIADTYQAVVSCQGVIAEPGGGLWEITTGHSGLGTSGSGDVLAGAIAGLRGRGTTNAQATCWGSHLHAAAGDRLASRLGGLGYLARELCDELPPLMVELSS
ncbi:NAD(P)H-hydrate dehydratase [Arthrobacter sp. B3I4]|uniref:NAD(P)H-hydrate dehydratase n=1 Tax=Arthrobacter sp. B3I4 TaxID=3042267 RepID=UPI00278AFD1D|nr:ADP-dependent NAD(P)H-hydrate dehydratase [Arthrobacter sp. B3I4]